MGSLHPAVRIANYCLLIVIVAHAHMPVLLIVAVSAVLVSGKRLLQCLLVAATFGWRLRWLLLSLLVLYLVFTPGTPLISNIQWLPSQEGLVAAINRLLTWAVILFLFALFHLHTTRAQWQAGIYWLAKPFAKLGLSAERLTIRMLLTFQAVSALQQNQPSFETTSVQTSWHNLITRLTAVLIYAHEQAEYAELKPIQVETSCPPTFAQWRSFFVLFVVLMGLAVIDYFLFTK
jgi:hypothetical protein